MELSKEDRQEVERMKQLIRSQMTGHYPTKEEIEKRQEQERIQREKERKEKRLKKWEEKQEQKRLNKILRRQKIKDPKEREVKKKERVIKEKIPCLRLKPGTYLHPDEMVERFQKIKKEDV